MSHQIKLVCFDLDGTLLDGTIFIWQTLHDWFATDRDLRAEAKEDFFAGRISYEQWFDHDLVLLSEKGATRGRIMEALEGVGPMPGARETLEELRRRGYRLAVISGSLDVVLQRFYPDFHFDHVLISSLDFDGEGRLAGGTPTLYDLERKADGLRELARREDLPVEACAFIGDNFNDLEVAQAAGLSISFNSKSEELDRIADLVIGPRDLTEILGCFPDLQSGRVS